MTEKCYNAIKWHMSETVSYTHLDVYKRQDKDIDYEYGAGKTFHSDEPVTYSMMFSDHENYPYKDDWRIWSAIEEKTNVKFDPVSYTHLSDRRSRCISWNR